MFCTSTIEDFLCDCLRLLSKVDSERRMSLDGGDHPQNEDELEYKNCREELTRRGLSMPVIAVPARLRNQ